MDKYLQFLYIQFCVFTCIYMYMYRTKTYDVIQDVQQNIYYHTKTAWWHHQKYRHVSHYCVYIVCGLYTTVELSNLDLIYSHTWTTCSL